MPRIALITSGNVEYYALKPSLERVFPDAEFSPVTMVNSFTSARLTYPPPTAQVAKRPVDHLAAALVGAVDEGKKRDRADFAIAIDDLELVNLDQPEVVVRLFVDAVQQHLQTSWPSDRRRGKSRERAREHCSFHLFVPMIETYFLKDPTALSRAGARRIPVLLSDCDVEAFETNDVEYLAGASTDQKREQWLRQHPKEYLKFLCQSVYRETRQGTAALESLDWSRVLVDSHHCRFARSLMADIAEMLDIDCPFPGETEQLTSQFGRQDSILRNIALDPE